MNEIVIIVILVFVTIILVVLFCNYPKEGFSDQTTPRRSFSAPQSLTELKPPGYQITDPKQIQSTFKDILNKTYYIKRNVFTFLPEYLSSWDLYPGCLPEAMYQGNCGSCWAFAAVTCLSSRFYIESCGNTGCYNYPQMNVESLELTLGNINKIYKFRQSSFTEFSKRIKKNKLNLKEWIEIINQTNDIIKQNNRDKYVATELMYFMLNFQSLGSINLGTESDQQELLRRSKQTFILFSNGTDTIDFKKLKEGWLQRPIPLSAEKLIACCANCTELPSEKNKNPQCSGGTLTGAWESLRDFGTTTTFCFGYNLDRWVEGDNISTCRELMGPNFGYCSSYHSHKHEDPSIFKGINEIELNNPAVVNPQNDHNNLWSYPVLFTFRAKNAYEIKNDMISIQNEIMQRGPVTAGFYIYEDFQYLFGEKGRGGQLHKEGDPILGGTEKCIIYMKDPKIKSKPIGGHAITITGWGVYKNIPYWTCLNSWGIQWGTSGYTKYGKRDSLPVDRNGGGYFWIVRGINNCDIENNVVAGQPDLYNITYKDTIKNNGWGLPSPRQNEVKIIPQEKNKIVYHNKDPKNNITIVLPNPDSLQSDSYIKKISDNQWNITPLDTAKYGNPYDFFWPRERPRYLLGNIQSNLYPESTSNIPLDTKTLSNIRKIMKYQSNPVFLINDEQIQLMSINKNSISAYRGVNNTQIHSHKLKSELLAIPYQNLTIKDLESLGIPHAKKLYSEVLDETYLYSKYESPTIPPSFYKI